MENEINLDTKQFIIKALFSTPKIVAVIGDINEGKSNVLYYFLEELKKIGAFKLYTYGLRSRFPDGIEIFSVNELEQIRNSIIILDEVLTLFDLDDRMAKKQIEQTLRLIFHNNNVLVISAVPENIKKFISSKINVIIYKKCTLADFINGSSVKRIIQDYKGAELGHSVLNLESSDCLIYNGMHYIKMNIPYLEKYDIKKNNQKIVKENSKKV